MSRTYYSLFMEFAIEVKDAGEPDIVVTKKFINKLNKGNKATEKLKRKKPPKEVEVTESKERLL